MSLLSRALRVRPKRPHPVRVQRDLAVPAADGVTLLAERGYQVLYQSLRSTGGSGGRFNGFVVDPADDDGTLSWLRAQPWFGDTLATWGASYLGFAQWELAASTIPEWRIAVTQDATRPTPPRTWQARRSGSPPAAGHAFDDEATASGRPRTPS